MVRLGLLPKVHLPHGRAYIHSSPVSGLLLKQKTLNYQRTRYFKSTARIWQKTLPPDQKAEAPNPSRADTLENVKPETVEKASNAKPRTEPKTDTLLSEQTVSNKEQRKADWAIMKEMSRYLWPKVRQSYVRPCIGVPDWIHRMTSVQRSGLVQLWLFSLVQRCCLDI